MLYEVITDCVARYKRMQGFDVMFLTGTDEHGQKIEKKATEEGVTPQKYVDDIVENFKKLETPGNMSSGVSVLISSRYLLFFSVRITSYNVCYTKLLRK